MTPEDARSIINAFREESREAYRLALAASLAARVEPELVRALRLELFPETDAGAEADLWFSQLVQAQTPLVLEFEPAVLELLRQDLTGEQELLRSAWGVLREFHGDAPFALQLEEELTYLGLCGESNEAVIEKRLNSVLAAVSAGQRPGLARWANRALPSLPGKVSNTDAASRLSVVAGVQTNNGPALTAMPSKGMTEEWLSQITARKISRVKVGVRLLKNDVRAPVPHPPIPGSVPSGEAHSNEGAADVLRPETLPMSLEFSYPPVPGSEMIEVPDTYRLLLEVSWQETERRALRQLSLLPDERRPVEVGYGEVRIRTALGDIFTLRPRFDFDFLLIYESNVEPWARNLIERLERQKWGRKRLRVAATPLDAGALLPPELEKELRATFGLSRKVGFAVSGAHVLTQLEPARPEPHGRRDWLIPIKVGSIEPYFDSGSPALDFQQESRLDDSFRALWKAITGEDLPLPKAPQKAEAARSGRPLSVFISYSHKDKKLRDRLLTHLAPLERQGLIKNVGDEVIYPGQEWASEINRALETARIILLLVSPDYLSSDYIFDKEMKLSMDRHASGQARVIPIILRPCDWESAPFSKLQALPDGAKPITRWRQQAEAFLNITENIRLIAKELQSESEPVNSLPVLMPRPPVFGFVARRGVDGTDIVEQLKEELTPGRHLKEGLTPGRRLKEKSTPGGHPLIALWGAGGVGKTTLAAEAVRELQPVYHNRIVWSSVDRRADFTLHSLLDDIATRLDAPESRPLSLPEKEQAVRALVASAPTLVVLDNHETIAPDEQQRIEQWLERADCATLITSRQRTGRAWNITIPAMSADEAAELLDRLIEQTSNPRVFSGEVRHLIMETAGGNPLIIQWVVGQIDSGQEPEAVLEKLRHGEGDAAQRVFDSSFNLPQLGDDGRNTLLALALFVPDASRDALAQVAKFDANDAKRFDEAVGRLLSLRMVKMTDDNRRLLIEGLSRELAKSQLSRDDRAAEFHGRFVAYFLTYAEAHAKPTPEDFAALEAELDNLLSAMDLAFGLEDWSSVLRLMDAINLDGVNGLLTMHGYWDEAIRRGQQALQSAYQLQDEGAAARFAHNTAITLQNRGEMEEARRLYNESLEIALKFNHQSGIANALHELGRLAQAQGELEEAHRFYNESLEIKKKLGSESGISISLHALGTLAQAQGELEEARRLYNESLEINKRLGDQSGCAAALHELGLLALEQGKIKEGFRLCRESLKIQKQLGNQFGIAGNLQVLGKLTMKQGKLSEARQLLDESLMIYKQLGSQNGIADDLYELGLLAAQEGDKDEAVRLIRESLTIFKKLKSPLAKAVRGALANLKGES